MNQARSAWAALKNMLRYAAHDPLWAIVNIAVSPFRAVHFFYHVGRGFIVIAILLAVPILFKRLPGIRLVGPNLRRYFSFSSSEGIRSGLVVWMLPSFLAPSSPTWIDPGFGRESGSSSVHVLPHSHYPAGSNVDRVVATAAWVRHNAVGD